MITNPLKIIPVVLLAVTVLWPTDLLAQKSSSQGSVSTKNFAKIVKGTAISIEPEEATDLNERLRPVIARALRARGYRISENAAVRFIFNAESPETRGVKNNLRRSPERGSDLDRDPRRRSGSMQNPIIRQGLNLSGQPIKPAAVRHLVTVIVLHENGTQYWVGTAQIDGKRGDSFDITSSLSRELVLGLGKTVEGGKFNIN
jgi:hypothetical protein